MILQIYAFCNKNSCLSSSEAVAQEEEQLTANWMISYSISGVPGPHVEVSLGKTLNPVLSLIRQCV